MENKYYIPAPEEFHINFEYEFACESTIKGIKQPDVWVEATVDTPHELMTIMDRVPVMEDCYRVKYLDRSDIEKLGIRNDQRYLISTYDESFVDTYIDNQSKGLLINVNYADHKVLICYGNLNNFITAYRFSGTCKNLSELKVLIRQIVL